MSQLLRNVSGGPPLGAAALRPNHYAEGLKAAQIPPTLESAAVPCQHGGTGGVGQEGGYVSRTGVAYIHAGEVIANEQIMRNVGKELAGVGGMLTTAEPKIASHTVSFDGAVFHGVPDQRYVNSIFDTAVRGACRPT